MSRIPSKFIEAMQDGREFQVKYRWGEVFEGQTEWTDWDKGLLTFVEKANDKDEPGVNILDEGGWGYAGREKELEETFGHKVFGRYAEEENQHLLHIQFLE